MEYIANIITNNKVEISNFFNIKTEINDVDFSLPTLIVGWEKVKKLYPEQDILVKKISDNISWTFSKYEKRFQYEKDIECFIQNSIKNIDSKVNYHFFNYLLATEHRKKCFIEYVKNSDCSLFYNLNFLYIYSIKDNITIGISLKDLEYIGINIKDFIQNFNNNRNIISNNINDIGKNSLFLIKDNIKIIPYLNYLKNSDIYK